jgi:hypothetical protein
MTSLSLIVSSFHFFPRCSISNHYHRSLLTCARPERHPDTVRAGPAVLPSSSTYGSSVSCTPHHSSRWLPCMGLPMKTEVLVISPSCAFGDRATFFRPLGKQRSWLVYRTEFSSGRWPASGVGGHNCGWSVGGTLGLPHDLLWVVPCLGVPQIAGRKAVEVLARTLGRL